MNPHWKLALKRAIIEVLPGLQQLAQQFSEPYLTWRKENRAWHGEYCERPDITHALIAANAQLEKVGAPFCNALLNEYPKFRDGLVGCSGLGGQQLFADKTFVLRYLLGELWQRHGTFACNEAAVVELIEGFSEFIDRPTIRVRFQAELLNFRMAKEALSFPEGLVIRRLDEEEISHLNGGSLHTIGLLRPRSTSITEFVIEGEYKDQKLFAPELNSDSDKREEVRSQLDRAILSLRTFKEGRVGYDWIHYKFLGVCPLSAPSFGYSDLYIPAGTYDITDEEMHALAEHAQRIFAISDPAMETACRRLSDAEIRVRPEDQIVDAVIGMEALLLAALGNEDRRSELKYRFSIHYATLFENSSERRRAFKIAKDLYDLRSTLAHGSDVGRPPYRVGDKRLTLADAAKRAREALRRTVNHFLSTTETAVYKNPEFWERAYFGIGE